MSDVRLLSIIKNELYYEQKGLIAGWSEELRYPWVLGLLLKRGEASLTSLTEHIIKQRSTLEPFALLEPQSNAKLCRTAATLI